MLSSDKNVETIGQLIELLLHYLGLQTEYVKLDAIDKVVRLLTATALAILFFLLLVAVMMFFSFAAAFWFSQFVGMVWAFIILSLMHLALLIVLYKFRRKWIERPLVQFLANLLMSK